jgi:hypothetical protein
MSAELNELKKISKLLTLANADVLERELGKVATTPERKKIWILVDGETMPDELIKNSGMKQAALYNFIKALANADLIENPHGKAPKKKLEFVPASWLDLLQPEPEDKKKVDENDKA